MTSVAVNSARGEHTGTTASTENVSKRNNTLCVLNTNDETRNNFLDQVSELSDPGTHFDRQLHTNHNYSFFRRKSAFCNKVSKFRLLNHFFAKKQTVENSNTSILFDSFV